MSTDPFDRSWQHQKDFFAQRRHPDMLVLADCTGPDTAQASLVRRYSTPLSERLIEEHAFDLGVQAVENARATAQDHVRIGDDRLPAVMHNWGTGYTAAMITGGDLIFRETTTYTTGPIVRNGDDLTALRFDGGNRWIAHAVSFWRGATSRDISGIVLMPHAFRSPLDLALDLRGSALFSDLYDTPEHVNALLDFCTRSLVSVNALLSEAVPELNVAPRGAWGVALPAGAVFLNGDPVDLISPAMGSRFNRASIETVAQKAGPVYFHHHSIGVSRALDISRIGGLCVQEILQDPNGPRLAQSVNEDLISASQNVPLHLHANLAEYDDADRLLERLAEGRFIVNFSAPTAEECRAFVAKVRHVCPIAE